MTRTEDEGLMSLLCKSVSESLTLSITACVTIFHSSKDGEGDMARTEDGGLMSIISEASVGSARQASILKFKKNELIVAYVAY